MFSTSAVMRVPANNRLREVLAFALVGLLNTALDFAVLNGLIALTHQNGGLWLFGSDVCAFTVGVVSSYVLNARFTFRQQGLGRTRTIMLFLGVSLIGLLLNASIVLLLRSLLGATVAPTLAINGSKLVATGVSLCWNYLALRRWVFVPTGE